MRKLVYLALPILVACQSSGVGGPAPAQPTVAVPAPSPEPVAKPQAKLNSGFYTHKFRTRDRDGKGRLRNEFGSFSYWLEEIVPGAALVRYEGDATYATRGRLGGTDNGWIKVEGVATLKQGVWVLQTTERWRCEARFQLEANVLRHISALCDDAGPFGHYAWPPAQTRLKLQRALTPVEATALRALRRER